MEGSSPKPLQWYEHIWHDQSATGNRRKEFDTKTPKQQLDICLAAITARRVHNRIWYPKVKYWEEVIDFLLSSGICRLHCIDGLHGFYAFIMEVNDKFLGSSKNEVRPRKQEEWRIDESGAYSTQMGNKKQLEKSLEVFMENAKKQNWSEAIPLFSHPTTTLDLKQEANSSRPIAKTVDSISEMLADSEHDGQTFQKLDTIDGHSIRPVTETYSSAAEFLEKYPLSLSIDDATTTSIKNGTLPLDDPLIIVRKSQLLETSKVIETPYDKFQQLYVQSDNNHGDLGRKIVELVNESLSKVERKARNQVPLVKNLCAEIVEILEDNLEDRGRILEECRKNMQDRETRKRVFKEEDGSQDPPKKKIKMERD